MNNHERLTEEPRRAAGRLLIANYVLGKTPNTNSQANSDFK